MKNCVIKLQSEFLGTWYYSGMSNTADYTGALVGEFDVAVIMTREEAEEVFNKHFANSTLSCTIVETN